MKSITNALPKISGGGGYMRGRSYLRKTAHSLIMSYLTAQMPTQTAARKAGIGMRK